METFEIETFEEGMLKLLDYNDVDKLLRVLEMGSPFLLVDQEEVGEVVYGRDLLERIKKGEVRLLCDVTIEEVEEEDE